MCAVLISNKLNTVKEHVFTFMLSAGLYPEIPEASQLDFSSLKEEVPPDPLLFFYLSVFHIETLYTSVHSLFWVRRASGFSSSIISFPTRSCWTNRDKRLTAKGAGPESILRRSRSAV